MKKIDLKSFDLQKLTISGKSILIDYFNSENKNDLITVNSDSAPSTDLLTKLNAFGEIAAECLGLLSGWDFSRDHIKKNDEALKLAMHSHSDVIESVKISKVEFVGGDGKEGVKMALTLSTDFGNVKIPSTGVVRFSDEDFPELGQKAQTAFEELKSEAYLFVFKGKRDNDLFNQKESKSDNNGEGLGNSLGTSLKAV